MAEVKLIRKEGLIFMKQKKKGMQDMHNVKKNEGVNELGDDIIESVAGGKSKKRKKEKELYANRAEDEDKRDHGWYDDKEFWEANARPLGAPKD